MSQTDSISGVPAPKTLREHVRATLVLGVPLAVMQIVHMLVNVSDTLMLGWLGVKELAAGTLAFQVLFMAYIFGLGFSAALMPLVANALGREDEQAVRRSTRMGLWVLSAVVMVFMVPLSFGEEILLALGQKPELAALADSYLVIAKWSLVPAFLHVGLRNFLASIEHTKALLWITVGMALLNAFLNYGLIFGNFGMPRLEMQGAAIATVLANTAAFVAIALYVGFSTVSRRYQIFVRLWRPDWPAFSEIFRLGFPISLTIFAEAGLFSAASLMIGWIGTVELAAHGIALQLAGLAFMVPLGISQAASVRVGNSVGRNDLVGIGFAGGASVLLGLAIACVSAVVFIVFPEPLIQPFLDGDTEDARKVLSYATGLLIMAAAFQIFDSLQVASLGNLRGLKDTKVPMIIASVSYWPIGLGAAYLFGFVLNFGGMGVWAGLVVGLLAASIGLTYRFSKREHYGLV